MPLDLSCKVVEAWTLPQLVEHLREAKLDPSNLESLAAAAPALQRLSNNKTFLSEEICSQLGNYRNIQDGNAYTPQVFMLYGLETLAQRYFIRACFWPAAVDQLVHSSGSKAYFYGVPHDHNFNFLTIGHHGPGYVSDYYEYDYDSVVGYEGEPVTTCFTGRSALHPDRILLYRAMKDIHSQLPPDSFSVSLNIMENSPRSAVLDQYEFSADVSRVARIIGGASPLPLFSLVAASTPDEGSDLLLAIFKNHPLDRVRMHALQAVASASGSRDEALSLLGRVNRGHSCFMRETARRLASRIATPTEKGSDHADN